MTSATETSTKVGESIAAELSGGDAKFWLHLDVDILDRDVFPATDYLMPDGLSMAELRALITPLASSPGLIGVDVTCFNPEKDEDRSCGTALAELLRSPSAQHSSRRAAPPPGEPVDHIMR